MKDPMRVRTDAMNQLPRLFAGALTCAALATGCYFQFENPIEQGEQSAAERLQACIEACPRVIAAECGSGPSDIASCEEGCRTSDARCPAELGQIKACLTADTAYRCDASDLPTPVGCETEQLQLMACLNDDSGTTDDEAACRLSCNVDGGAVNCTSVDFQSCVDQCVLRAEAAPTASCASCVIDHTAMREVMGACVIDDGYDDAACATVCERSDPVDLRTPLEACLDACPDTVAAGCPHGPPDVAGCNAGCGSAAELCGDELEDVMRCSAGASGFSCDAAGAPYPVGCQAEQSALMDCLNSIP